MHRILQDIIRNTTEEVKKRQDKTVFVKDTILYKRISFKDCILNPKVGDISLIAEVKLFSPTLGKLGEQADILKRLHEYQNTGADAVSIITEKEFFKGNPELVTIAKKSDLGLPILQKDFVIDEFQIQESYRLGSDALLLIARIINTKQLNKFVKLCKEKKIESIVEICNEDDLKKAVSSETEIIAVNARDLDTFEVEIDKACKLSGMIPG